MNKINSSSSPLRECLDEVEARWPGLHRSTLLNLVLATRALSDDPAESISMIDTALDGRTPDAALDHLVETKIAGLPNVSAGRPCVAFVHNNVYPSLVTDCARIAHNCGRFEVLNVLAGAPEWTLESADPFNDTVDVFAPAARHVARLPVPRVVVCTEYVAEEWFAPWRTLTTLSQVSHYLETDSPLRALLMRISRGLHCTHFWSTASTSSIPDNYFEGLFPVRAAPSRPPAITVIEAGYPKLDRLAPKGEPEDRIVVHLGKSASAPLHVLPNLLASLRAALPVSELFIRPFLHESSADGLAWLGNAASLDGRMIIDSGARYDAMSYSKARAMVCVGESSSATLFALATGRPCVALRAGSNENENDIRRFSSVDELVAHLAQALTEPIQQTTARTRDNLVQLGHAAEYFADALMALCENRKLEDWREFPLRCPPGENEDEYACRRLRELLSDFDYRAMLPLYQRLMPALLPLADQHPWLPVDFAAAYMAHAAHYAGSLDAAHTLPVGRDCLLAALSLIVDSLPRINSRCDAKIDVTAAIRDRLRTN